jgi:hypothetical protein
MSSFARRLKNVTKTMIKEHDYRVTAKWQQIENNSKILHHKTKQTAVTHRIIILNVNCEIPVVKINFTTNISVPGA